MGGEEAGNNERWRATWSVDPIRDTFGTLGILRTRGHGNRSLGTVVQTHLEEGGGG